MNVIVVGVCTVIRSFKSQNVGDKCSGVDVEGMKEPTFLSNTTNISVSSCIGISISKTQIFWSEVIFLTL